MVYIVCLPIDQKDLFLKAHHKNPRDVTEVNLGDTLIYVNSRSEERSVVFMGKSIEGKYILHFNG